MSSNERFDTRSPSAYPTFPGTTVGVGAAVDTRAVFGQTMGLVGLTTGFAAAGAYIGRNLGPGTAMVMWLLSLGAVFGMSFARRARSGSLGMSLLFATGLLLGMAVGPTMSRVASTSGGTQIIWEAAGLTGLFIAGFGVAGWATKRDLAPAMRIAFFALLALIVAGFVAIFVSIPGFHMIYAIAGLAIFSVFTMFDFQRLRHAGEEHSVFLALSIFLDVFNVFLLFVNLLGGGGRR